MTDKNKGIILKTYIPNKQKICILDESLGLIEVCMRNSIGNQRLVAGAYITYNLKSQNNFNVISGANILDMPAYWTQNDFLFFHHILELCRYFIPINSSNSDIFSLIDLLYKNPMLVDTDFSKKIFLCRFFVLLGVQPNNKLSNDAFFFNLISAPLGSNLSESYKDKYEHRIKNWLLECINFHPYANQIKTLNFLKNVNAECT